MSHTQATLPARALRLLIGLILMALWSQQAFGQWALITAMPGAKEMHATTSLDGYIYVLGGSGPSSVCYRYNIATSTWSTIASLPTPVAYPSAVGYNGKVYVTGGYAGCCGGTETSALQIYDPVTNTWSVGAAMPGNRATHGSAALGGLIYVVGGSIGATLYNTLFAYNPVLNTWTTLASMPTARYQVVAGAAYGKLYALGGYSTTWLTTNEEYDPATNTWATRTAMPIGRYLHGGSGFLDGASEKVFVCGGYAGTWQNTCRQYDPLTNAWTAMSNMVAVRGRTSGTSYLNCLYMPGGYSGSASLSSAESTCFAAVLPMGLLFFEGYRQDEALHLQWAFEEQASPARTELQRSWNGQQFESLQADAANAQRMSAGQWMDVEPLALAASEVHYRLKMVGEDGSFTYSEVVTFDLSSAAISAAIHPNPVQDQIHCEIMAHETQQVKFTVADALGREHLSGLLMTVEGHSAYQLDASALASGVYFLRLTGQGCHQMVRFVKD